MAVKYLGQILLTFIGSAIANSKVYSLVEKQKKEVEEKNKIIEKIRALFKPCSNIANSTKIKIAILKNKNII